MKGYKGFNKGLICRDKQYKENTVFEEDTAEICYRGMHFCKNPLDVLNYYPLIDNNGNLNEFAEVEALDDTKTDDHRKYCTKKLKIGAKLELKNFINISVEFLKEITFKSSGDNSQLASSGYNSQLASSGEYSQLASSGYNSQLASSGYNSIVNSTGNDSVVMNAGINGIAKAKKESWITLAEFIYNAEKDSYIPVAVKTEQVDGEKIKEDTYYKLVNGEFKEV